MHHDQRVCALEPAKGRADRIGQIAFVGILDQVRDHLCIRLGLERVAAGHKLVAELAEILDDAVVDDGDAARAVAVRMGVEVARPAVRGPASVSQPDPGSGRIAAERVGQDCHLAGPLLDEQIAVLGDQGYPGGVVAPVLEAPQAIQQDGPGLAWSGVADYSAHAD